MQERLAEAVAMFLDSADGRRKIEVAKIVTLNGHLRLGMITACLYRSTVDGIPNDYFIIIIMYFVIVIIYIIITSLLFSVTYRCMG